MSRRSTGSIAHPVPDARCLLPSHRHTPPGTDSHRQALLQAFSSLARQPIGKTLLQGIQMDDPVPASMKEYEPLAALGLEQFVQLDGDK